MALDGFLVRLEGWCRFLRVQIWEALAYQFDRFMVFRLVAGYGLMFLGKGFRFVAWNAVLCYWQGLTGFEPRLCVFCELETWQVLGWRFFVAAGFWLRLVASAGYLCCLGYTYRVWNELEAFCLLWVLFLLFCNFLPLILLAPPLLFHCSFVLYPFLFSKPKLVSPISFSLFLSLQDLSILYCLLCTNSEKAMA